MQINRITETTAENRKPKVGELTDNSSAFHALLEKVLDNSISEEEQGLPKVWSNNKFGNGAINNVVEFLSKRFDIIAGDRVPVYEISGENLEWFKSRHPSDELEQMQAFTAEEANLLADMVYQNIISPDDARTLQAVLVPEHDLDIIKQSEQNGFLSELFPSDTETDYLEKLDNVMKTMEELIAYYSEKAKGTTGSVEDSIYVQNAKSFAENKQAVIELLADIVGS